MEFTKRSLGDICDEVRGIVQTGPFGSQLHKSDYKSEGIPVVMPKNIIEDKISTEEIARIGKEDVERLSQHKLQKGDIVYGRRGDIGRRAFVKEEQTGWLCGTGCIKISLKSASILDPSFLYYYLGQTEIVSWIYNQAIGATMPNLNTSIIRSIPITYPSLNEQKKIASVLYNYDDLIDNNTRRIEILEQIAKLIYEEWFVKFRFPGHENVKMVYSEFGDIPEGWGVKYLREVSEVKYGFPFKSKLFTQESKENNPVIRIRDIVNGFTTTFTSEDVDEDYFVKNGDILVGMDGDFHMSRWSGGKAYLNQRVVRFRPKLKSFSWYYLYFALRPKIKYFDDTITGTTVAHLSARDINSIKLVYPSEDILSKIYDILEPINILELNVKIKNQNLRKTRDLLLPKLISGEIDVSDLDIRIRNELQET
jgi:type I restriction enzyme, S subunit